MIISQNHQFIFIHIPKTGGTSVKKSLAQIGIKKTKVSRFHRLITTIGINRNFNKYRFRTHGNLKTVEKIMPDNLFNQYFKFSVVRNPWDRLVSEYIYAQQGSEIHQSAVKRKRHKWLKNITQFEDFVHIKAQQKDASQFSYLCLSDGTLGIDFFARQEHLNEDFTAICNKLNIRCTLSKKNLTKGRAAYIDYYDAALFNFVQKAWYKDITTFGYDNLDYDKLQKKS